MDSRYLPKVATPEMPVMLLLVMLRAALRVRLATVCDIVSVGNNPILETHDKVVKRKSMQQTTIWNYGTRNCGWSVSRPTFDENAAALLNIK